MSCIEIAFRIIELVIAISVPALIAFFGIRLTKKTEEIKNESASKHLWRTKWIDVLFQKHLVFLDNTFEFNNLFVRLLRITNEDLAKNKEKQEEYNWLIHEVNSTCIKLKRSLNDLKVISSSIIGRDNAIVELIDQIWGDVVHIVDNKRMDDEANFGTISDKLINLNRVTEELIQKKFK